MKKCSILLALRNLKIKVIMRYHLALVTMAMIKTTTTKTNAGEYVEKKKLLYTLLAGM